MLLFWFFYLIVIAQRLSEIWISNRHTAWMRSHGGVEFGAAHFPWVVALTVSFFLGVPVESLIFQTQLVSFWPWLLGLFLLAQGLRYWAMVSLGTRWNVRIWVIPGEKRIVRGPYRFLSHPNYIAVTVEFITLPLMIGCWRTAVLGTAAYLYFLKIRLKAEEHALKKLETSHATASIHTS